MLLGGPSPLYAAKVIRESEQLHAVFEHLLLIPGIGTKSATLLLGELTMLPEDMSVREWVRITGDPPTPALIRSVTSSAPPSKSVSASPRWATQGSAERFIAGTRGGAARPAHRFFLREAVGERQEANRCYRRRDAEAAALDLWNAETRSGLPRGKVLPDPRKSARSRLTFKRVSNGRALRRRHR